MIHSRLSAAEAAQLAEQVSQLAAAGLPLAPGLRAAADDAASNRLASVLHRLAAEIEAGATLDTALGAVERHLPSYVRGAIAAGVRSGQLAAVLARLVHADHAARQLRREIRLALAYPLLLLAMIVALAFFVVFFVLPEFRVIYADFETELPAMTAMLLSVSEWGRAMWAATPMRWVLIVLAVLPVLVQLARFAESAGWASLRWLAPASRFFAAFATWPSRIFSTMPLIGPMFLWQAVAEWSRLVALLVDARVPLPEALELAAQGTPSPSLSRLTEPLAAGVRSGHSLGQLIEHSFWLPASLGPLVDWGNKSGALAETFRTAAEMFEGRVRLRAAMLKQIGPPIMFLVVASFLSLVVAAMFLPLMKLIQTLS